MMFRTLTLAALFCSLPAWAQLVEVPEEKVPAESTPATGKERATEYFQSRKNSGQQAPRSSAASANHEATPRFLMIHAGTYVSDQGFKWGDGTDNNIGRFNAGVTYRFGEWVNSMDWMLRIDYSGYKVQKNGGEQDARKLGVSAILTFPDANSRFPLYFGGGLGPGFFIKQLDGESALTLDYSLIVGARFLDVIENTGFMIESGLKNHLHLLSDGQFNGVYVNVGCVFAF